MRINLIERCLLDLHKYPASFRQQEDVTVFGLTEEQCSGFEPPEGFKDWGVVIYEGKEFYMSSYNPPADLDDR